MGKLLKNEDLLNKFSTIFSIYLQFKLSHLQFKLSH